MTAGRVLVGADRILEPPYLSLIADRKVGLVTNQTGVDSRLRPTAAVLAGCPGTDLAALFGPEHGYLGYESAEKPVASTARVHSLFGRTKKPTPEMLAPLDVLVFDIQDLGTRFYTYISTLFLCMQAAAECAVPMVVLDRPNPIGGVRVEGPRLDPALRSFVGIFDLPVRYGLTPGELALYFNAHAGLGCSIQVVPLAGWRRQHWFDQTGLQWISPSPGIATLDTATVYPGLCLLEGTNLSYGHGTVKPFELVGAPWLKADALAGRLNELALPGAVFRPQVFVPESGRYVSQICRGLQLHVTDREQFRPLDAALYLVASAIALHPQEFAWRAEHFDRLAGTGRLRQALAKGDSIESITSSWREGIEAFERERGPRLLYD